MQKKLIALVIGLSLVSCQNKKPEATNQTTQNQQQIGQGAWTDSGKVNQPTQTTALATGEKKKPESPVPVEQMTREQLSDYKKLLTEKGFYNCCIEPSCRMCVIELQECNCEQHAKRMQGVCGECYDGWQIGKGKTKGVKSDNIKKM